MPDHSFTPILPSQEPIAKLHSPSPEPAALNGKKSVSKKKPSSKKLQPPKPVESMTPNELEAWEVEQAKRQRSAIAHKESSQRFRDRTKEKNRLRDEELNNVKAFVVPNLQQQLQEAQRGQPPCVCTLCSLTHAATPSSRRCAPTTRPCAKLSSTPTTRCVH